MLTEPDCNADRNSAPIGVVGTETAAVCRCGAGPHADDPRRCAAGHQRVGVVGLPAVVEAHSAAFWRQQEHARRAIVEDVIADAGHSADDAPRALQVACDGIAQATLVRDSAFARMVESGGPLTANGRTRRAFTVWLAASDRLERHLRLVGLKRRAHRIAAAPWETTE